jgi:hypothetical protein
MNQKDDLQGYLSVNEQMICQFSQLSVFTSLLWVLFGLEEFFVAQKLSFF